MIYIWRHRDEDESPDCVCPTAKQKVSVMIWGCIAWYDVGTLTTVDDTINRHKYTGILEINLLPVFYITCFKMTMPLYIVREI